MTFPSRATPSSVITPTSNTTFPAMFSVITAVVVVGILSISTSPVFLVLGWKYSFPRYVTIML